MARKPVDEDQAALWASVTKTVTPLEKRTRLSSPAAVKPVKRPAKKKTTPPPPPSPERLPPRRQINHEPADLSSPGYGGISRSDARRIKRGQARPTDHIDLHGLSRDEARLRLERFLGRAVAEGHRVVLVITGKGVAGQGVIRRNLPVWLSSPPLAAMVIAHSPAQPKDGGAGAFYINLRAS
ncbi:MAG: Smr/MutS family protein [Candidatus Puniceispirillales bacterium]